jgi:3-oxoacyl-[acyl-carrier-protein] synthase II
MRRLAAHTATHGGFPAPPNAPQRRVVVTGLGLVTPLGVGAALSWQQLLAGACGARALTADDLPGVPGGEALLQQLPVRFAAVVPRGGAVGALDLDRWGERGKLAPFVAFALAAADEALRHAGLLGPDGFPAALRSRTGVSIGSGMGHVAEVAAAGHLLAGGALRRLSPHLVPRCLVNMAAGHVSMAHGLAGPLCAPATACASGAHALGDALRLLRGGEADVMLSGGSEAVVDAVALAGFARARALAPLPTDGDPRSACRPFDAGRTGFVLAEGAALLVLEELEHARARGAPVLAELRGCGLSADAWHPTAPPADGRGALAAMRAALLQAGVPPHAVGYCNAHATGTRQGDEAEAAALVQLLTAGDRGASPPMLLSSTKGATGHLLGAAGAAEAAFCVMALSSGVVPHTLNLTCPDAAGLALATVGAGAPVQLLADAPRRVPDLRAVLSNSFGFGGANASLCFTLPPDGVLAASWPADYGQPTKSRCG